MRLAVARVMDAAQATHADADAMTNAKTILCAVDLSPGCERVVSQAAELAELMGCQLALLHVYALPLLPLEEGDPDGDDEVARVLGRAQRELTELGAEARAQGIEVRTLACEGDVSDTILQRVVSLGAHMLVVGTHGRKGVKHLVLGSTAERVIRTSRAPVVVVPTPD